MEVKSQPAVIEIEALLAPISEDAPTGESLVYSLTDTTYADIKEARRADDNLNQGQWQREVKVADSRRVIELSKDALQTKTKDLQIGAWFAEALVREHGFAGMRDSLILMRGLHENYWETVFPEADAEDPGNEFEGRANALEFFDRQVAFVLKEISLTTGDKLSFLAFEESKQFDIPDNLETLPYDQQEKLQETIREANEQKKVTGSQWRKAKEGTRRMFYEEILVTLQECWSEFQTLERIVDEKFDRQTPGLNTLKKTLDILRDTVKKIRNEKQVAEPWETDTALEAGESEGDETGEGESSGGGGQVMMQGIAISVGAIGSRQDALKTLSQVAEFLQKTEPHTPVSYLVLRAVKWGNMSFDQVMRELVKDESVMGQINEMLGVEAASGKDGY